jgi:hypothetical protein
MPAIFTEQMARKQELHEAQRHAAAEQSENERRQHECVLVFVWAINNELPAIHEVQDGFKWPCLVLNDAMCTRLGLSTGISLGSPPFIKRFNPTLSSFVLVAIGDSVKLTVSDCLFFKLSSIQNPFNFDEYTRNSTVLQSPPHLQRKLPFEWASVRNGLHQQKLDFLEKPM